jgi:hypothetical protein
MQGAIAIGNVISSLFPRISNVLDGIVVLFNKVPKQEIDNFKKLISNKILNLNEADKNDYKLTSFLHIL